VKARPAALAGKSECMAQVDEIVEGIYRICSLPPGEYPVGFNQFLIDDELPTLVRTGFYDSYEAVRDAVAQVLDPRRLAYVVLGHFESDECGGRHRFLAEAPSYVLLASEPPPCASWRHLTSTTGTR
jgi:hypothetical protein